MAILTVNPVTAQDGYAYVQGNTFNGSDVASGADAAASFVDVGVTANKVYQSYEGFLGFDTSGLTAAATISAATLTLNLTTASVSSGDIEVWYYDFGSTIDAADFRSAAQHTGLTAFGAFGAMTTGNNSLSGSNFGSISQTATTRLLVSHKAIRQNAWPGASSFMEFNTVDSANPKPQLSITYTTNSNPTVALSSPADTAGGVSLTPTFSFTVTDSDSSQTVLFGVDISTANTFTSFVYQGSSSAASPLSSAAESFTPGGGVLSAGTTYYWRAWADDQQGSGRQYSGTRSFTTNTVPTISLSSPADGTTGTLVQPTLQVLVTDPDSSQTLTVTIDIATDSGFTNIVQSPTGTTSSPASSVTVSITPSTLSLGTLYYWRARVSDGVATSANTASRTFVTRPFIPPTVVQQAVQRAANY